ncbi:hypothetical protein D3C84_967490 [compost metagenome]
MQREPFSLDQLAVRCDNVDWILAEGFKSADYPKLIIVRSSEDAQLVSSLSSPAAIIVWPDTPSPVIAALNDRPDKLPVIGLDDTDQMLRILHRIRDDATRPTDI